MKTVGRKDDMYPVLTDVYGLAVRVSGRSTCLKNHSGAVLFDIDIVGSKARILGVGYNKPTLREMCCVRQVIHGGRNVELCSAIHAEEMAVLSAIRELKSEVFSQSALYLMYSKSKSGPDGVYSSVFIDPERVRCTLCSRLMAAYGVCFVCSTAAGFAILDPEEFNRKSLENVVAAYVGGQ